MTTACSILLWPLALLVLLPTSSRCRGVSLNGNGAAVSTVVSIERCAVPGSFFQLFDDDNDQPAMANSNQNANECVYAGEILLSHPMSVGKDDPFYVLGSQMLESAHISLDAINLWPRCGVRLQDGNGSGNTKSSYSLRLQTFGDGSSTNMTERIGTAIVNHNKTDFMLAGYSSTLTAHLAPIAQANQMLLLTAGSSRSSVHADRDYVFGLLPTSGSFLENAFRGLARVGATSVAFVTEEGVNSCLDAPEMAKKFGIRFLNGTILPEFAPYQAYPEVAQSFANLDPDIVVTCIRTDFAASWNQALREVHWSPKAQLYTIVVGTPEFEQAMGPIDLPFVMGVSSWDRALPPIPDGATGWTPHQFDAAFEQAAFRRPGYQHASQSAAISVLVQAIERVGTYIDMESIKHEIATGYFSTVYGNVSMDYNGQSAVPNLLMQYDANVDADANGHGHGNGTTTLHVLLPTSLKSTDFEMVYPMPSFDYRDCHSLSDCGRSNGTCAPDGTCDCQQQQQQQQQADTVVVSQGQGATAICVLPPPESSESHSLALSIAFPIIMLLIVTVVLHVYRKTLTDQDDSVWQIDKNDLIFCDPVETIGVGTFGVVLLGEYRGTAVAVKRILPPSEKRKQNHNSNNSRAENIGRTSVTNMVSISTKEAAGVQDNDNIIEEDGGGRGKGGLSVHTRNIGRTSMTMMGMSQDNKRSPSLAKQVKQDFISEMRCLNSLRHPSIITLLGAVMEPHKDPMLVMEYMQHGSLFAMLHNETMLLNDQILLPMLRDISSGCRYLQAAGVVHGDLKAQNILVDDKFRAKVADFGLSSTQKEQGATGTPFWMAPELLLGECGNTSSSDVYSFSMILYEAFSRKELYEGEEDALMVISQIADPMINRRPPIPKDCPTQISSLMKDCHAAYPEERPSFEEVDTRLKRIEPREEKSSSLSLFDIFPRHVAEALQQNRKVEAETFDSVTIFFSDIVNYTSISSNLHPLKVASMMDRLYRKFDDLSEKHDVFKVETIGDAYMAVTNLVKDQTADHAVRIAAFAMEAIKAANETLIDEEDPGKGYLNIRCGFHSGPVVADVVGSKNPRYCLFGDAVNTASRMESNSEQNRILCSKASSGLLKKQKCSLRVKQRGRIKVKGKGDMHVYWVGDAPLPELTSITIP